MNYSKKYCHKAKKIKYMFHALFPENDAGEQLFIFIFINKMFRKTMFPTIIRKFPTSSTAGTNQQTKWWQMLVTIN